MIPCQWLYFLLHELATNVSHMDATSPHQPSIRSSSAVLTYNAAFKVPNRTEMPFLKVSRGTPWQMALTSLGEISKQRAVFS